MQGDDESFDHGEYFFKVAKLFVFDLDGTLADTSQDIAVTLQETWAELGYTPVDAATVIGHIGHGAEHLITACLRENTPEISLQNPVDRNRIESAMRLFLRRYAAEPSRFAKPYEHVAEVLQTLAANPNHRLAVLTNKPEAPAEGLLQALDMRRYFAALIGGDSGFGLKPDITGLRYLMRRFETTCDETCLIGDGPQDAEAAEKANIRFYGFLRGIGRIEKHHHSASAQFFDTFADLLPLLLPQA